MRLPPSFLVAMAALGIVLGSGGGGGGVYGGRGVVKECGGVLTDSRGVLTTPNFPGPPPVPLHCRWVINASWAEDRDVTVYLSQQYVLDGLVISGYFNYGDKIDNKQQIFGSGNEHPISIEYVRSNQPYVDVELTLHNLENNHLRVLQDLREVYGFNITYEVTHKGEPARNSCSPIICSFVGQCKVSEDFRTYSCDCPANYTGPNCSWSPMCRPNPCKNGGKCRTTGSESIVCRCPANYSGVFCQYPPIEDNVRECKIESDKECSSGSVVERGRLLYTVNVSLVDSNEQSDICNKTNLKQLLSSATKESLSYLKHNLRESLNSALNNLIREHKTYDFDIVYITSTGDVTFQFKSYERKFSQVSKVLNTLLQSASSQPLFKWSLNFTENSAIENCTDWEIYLSRSDMSLKYDPLLYLQRVALNYNGPLSPTSQAVFSCVVAGSSNVSFSWYKENHLVIPGQSSRIWTQTSMDPKGTITSLLGVDNLSPLDDGRWTCRVRDGRLRLQQSRSVDLYVLQGPNVRMQPPATTATQGEKVFLSCLLSNRDRYQNYTYSWSRNGAPCRSGGDHVYEELNYPNGCLLRIQNITESATYTCHVESNVGKTSASARVEVVFENSTLCGKEKDWPAVPVGAVAMIECPEGREGSVASRRCSVGPTKAPQWTQADYSACLLADAVFLHDILREIRVGYAPSTPSQVLRQLYYVISNRTVLKPRQGEALFGVALEAWQMLTNDPKAHKDMLQIIDLLLSFPGALASSKVLNDIAKVSEKAAIAAMEMESCGVLLHHLSVSAVRPNCNCAETGIDTVFKLEESRRRWFASFRLPKLEVPPATPVVVVEFQSLKDIIPYKKRIDPGNVFYQILSTIAITSLPKLTEPPPINIETTFEDLPLNVSNFLDENKDDVSYWNITCAFSRNLTRSSVQWDLGSCTTLISRVNEDASSRRWLPWRRAIAFVFSQSKVSVMCLCPAPGSNAVFLAGFAQKPDSGVPSVAVVLALWCCAVEATAALVLPFVTSWKKKSGKQNPESATSTVHNSTEHPAPSAPALSVKPSESNIFMAFRVTSCTNAALVAIVMAVTMCKWDTIFPGVVLQCLLLLGISLPTAHLYLVAVELGAFPVLPVGSLWSRQYSRSHAVAVVLTIGPVVVFLALWLSIRDLRSTLSQCWTSWLEWGEPVCWAVAVPSSLVAAAGVVMAAMGRKLASIKTFSKRVHNDLRYGLVLRLCAILVCQLAFLLSAILYISAPGLASHVALIFASFLLGYSLLVCYVLRLEKQWPLLSVAWCNEGDSLDAPETARTSTSTTGPTSPALESPDSVRPLMVSSKQSQRPTWPQSNGVPKKSILVTSTHPLQSGNTFCSNTQSQDPAERSLLPFRDPETSPAKKNNGYLYMRGRATKVTCIAEVHAGGLGTQKPFRAQKRFSGEKPLGAQKPKRTQVPQPPPSSLNAQPQYQFRRRFLRLDDIEETTSAS